MIPRSVAGRLGGSLLSPRLHILERRLCSGRCWCWTPDPHPTAGLLQGKTQAVPRSAAGLAGVSVGRWGSPAPSEGPGCRLPAEPGGQTPGEAGVSLRSSAAGAAGAAEGKAAFSLQPSCGAPQPLGRIPAAGNDNLTQQAELGAFSSSKHSFLR